MLATESPDYRPDIDGLRAIAVLSVIAYHANATLLPGGLFGVDVFFVISGFLITGILSRNMEKGAFSFSAFLERRVRRLFPAFLVVAMATLVLGWFTLLPLELKELGVGVASASAALANVIFYLRTDYFAPAAELNPMLHTWSLSVEEQFYLIFPGVLLIIVKLKKTPVWAILGIGAFCGFFLSWAATASNPPAGFYLLPFRAWELLLGGAVATLPAHLRANDRKSASTAGLLGLAGICAAMVVHSDSTLHPGPITLLPALSTALVLWAGGAGPAGRILSVQPMVFVGLMSYSLYLWHQPIFAITRQAVLFPIQPWHLAGLFALIVALSWATLVLVERPFRQSVPGRRQRFFSGYLAMSLIVFGLGSGLYASNGAEARFGGQIAAFAAMADGESQEARACHSTSWEPRSATEACLHGTAASRTVAVWGDSHAVELSAAIPMVDQTVAVKQYTFSACPPVQGFYTHGKRECAKFHAEALDEIMSAADIEFVVIAARLTLGLKGRFDNGLGGVEPHSSNPARLIPMGVSRLSEKERRTRLLAAYRGTINDLLEAGKKVVVVYPVPEQGWNVPLRMAKVARLWGANEVQDIGVPLRGYLERQQEYISMLDTLPDDDRLLRVRPSEIFCENQLCRAADDKNHALYFDDDHLNMTGARRLAKAVLEVMP